MVSSDKASFIWWLGGLHRDRGERESFGGSSSSKVMSIAVLNNIQYELVGSTILPSGNEGGESSAYLVACDSLSFC